ncbi:hypothetical protein [Actinocorallia longicatena]|uniref:DUF8094 domain-containing protein n=1 Tax=Actinocorallia longicatena TaxID=111803 RepID=A0ABP6QJB2_9ACTN
MVTGFVLLSAGALSGCSDRPAKPRATPVAVAAPATDTPLTPASALKAFNLWANNDDVARATADERLGLTWADDGQVAVTASEFRKAARTGIPPMRFSYGEPTLWVPRLGGYPQWFVANVTRNGTPSLLALIKKSPGQRFRLSIAVTPVKGAKLPQIATDADGYATAMATRDESLLVGPSLVASLQAAVAEDGSKSFSAPSLQSGPFTTGLATQSAKEDKAAGKKDLIYGSAYTAPQLPVFPLRTKDGGCMVLYPLAHDVALTRRTDVGPLEAPADAGHLLPTPAVGMQMRISANLQYAAVVPPKPVKKVKNPARIAIVAAGGGPVRVQVKTA